LEHLGTHEFNICSTVREGKESSEQRPEDAFQRPSHPGYACAEKFSEVKRTS